LPKCVNDGQEYWTLARFDENKGKIQNLFYMMGYSNLKMTFTLNEWAAGKQMAR
jgi:hypothetical protein